MFWTEEELEIIRSNPTLDSKEISLLLPNRTHLAIQQKRSKIGIDYYGKRWTAEDDNYIISHRFDSHDEIGSMLNRPAESIRVRRKTLGAEYLVKCIVCEVVMVKKNAHNICSHCTKESEKEKRKSVEKRYSQYKHSAKKRNLKFTLTIEEFSKFKAVPCHYCGDVLENYGIDRVDSSVGYVDGNIVPCCETCNRMKSDHVQDDWVSHIVKVLKNLEGYHEIS